MAKNRKGNNTQNKEMGNSLEATILVQIMAAITSTIIATKTAVLKLKEHRISVTTRHRNLKEHQIITFRKDERLKNEDHTKEADNATDLESNKSMKETKAAAIAMIRIQNKKTVRKLCSL